MASNHRIPFSVFFSNTYFIKCCSFATIAGTQKQIKTASSRLTMATLQRTTKSFRRQGSSGSVWEGEKSPEEVNQLTGKDGNSEDQRQLRPCYSFGGGGVREGSLSNIGPTVCTRSLSTPMTRLTGDGGGFDLRKFEKHDK